MTKPELRSFRKVVRESLEAANRENGRDVMYRQVEPESIPRCSCLNATLHTISPSCICIYLFGHIFRRWLPKSSMEGFMMPKHNDVNCTEPMDVRLTHFA
jgi:hypothetical protein